MIFLKQTIIDMMCIMSPLSIYLIYIAYIKTIDKPESKYAIDITLLLSLLLLLLMEDDKSISTNVFFTTPLILSYLFKKDNLSIILSILLVFIYSFIYHANFIVLILFHTLYYVIYKIFLKDNKTFSKYIIYFISLKLIFTMIFPFLIKKHEILPKQCISFLIVNILGVLLFNLLTIIFLKESKKILEINTTFKELDKEKKLKASIFKLNHELKNPLAVCNGYLDMMPLATGEEKEKYLSIIKSEIKNSLTIINDFSQLGKIKNLNIEEIDLCLLLEDVKNILTPLYNKVGGIIEIPDKEIYIKGDYDRLKQVFINILKNSYESRSKRKLLVVIKIRKEKDTYKITITDNGVGMSKEVLKKIYEDFFTTKDYGTGIGIPYIREIITMHKGEINYTSKEGLSTTVTITLPIA